MFYPSSKVIIQHPSESNKILLVKRFVNGSVYYEPAGGKVEVDFEKRLSENLEECAVREIKEELGLSVSIDGYVGSYYFFWEIAPKKCSSCAVFVGKVLSKDLNFVANADSCELPIEPVWVNINDILEKRVTIDSAYVGLERLLVSYCSRLKKKGNLPNKRPAISVIS